jgi:hypothetical protein
LLGNLLEFSFGILLFVGGIFGGRFTIELSGKATAYPSYGRMLLVGNGLFLFAAGGARLLSMVHPQSALLGRPEFWNKAQGIFIALFESCSDIALACCLTLL